MAALVLPMLAAASHASAKTFEITRASGVGPGTLPAVIARADRHPGPDRIVFARSLRRDVRLTGRIKFRHALTISGRGERGPALKRIPGEGLAALDHAPKEEKGTFVVDRLSTRGVSIAGERLVVKRSDLAARKRGIAFGVYASDARVSDTTITGWGTGVGGGINSDLQVIDSIVTRNQTGIDLYGSEVDVRRSTISHNGTGIDSFYGASVDVRRSRVSGNSPGGGIAASYYVGVHVGRSTIAGNEAPSGAGINLGQAWASIENSTLSGNVATGPDSRGGGVWGVSWLGLQVRASTLTGNSADRGGAIFLDGGYDDDDATVASSIVAANPTGSGPECAAIFDGGAPASDPVSQGGNVFGSDGCGTALPDDVITTTPGLGPLSDNGGPTRTHALLPSSPAIDRGLDLGLATDQRGVPRDSQPDSGSFESD